MPGGFVCSGSFKGGADPDKVKRAAAGQVTPPKGVQQGPARVL